MPHAFVQCICPERECDTRGRDKPEPEGRKARELEAFRVRSRLKPCNSSLLVLRNCSLSHLQILLPAEL
jgi:hypothetical protein